jgi:hypothetical protein
MNRRIKTALRKQIQLPEAMLQGRKRMSGMLKAIAFYLHDFCISRTK